MHTSRRQPNAYITVAAATALVVTLISLVYSSHLHPMTVYKVLANLLWKNATVRPPILLIAIVAGWAWVVGVCRRRLGADLEHVLGGTLQHHLSTFHAALVLFCVLLSAHLMHFMASNVPGVTWRLWLVANLGLNGIFFILGLLPCSGLFFGPSRLSLLRAVWESIIAPFGPVTFWHVIVADYMTSLANAFSDLQLAACISPHIFRSGLGSDGIYVRSTELWHDFYLTCADSYANAIGLALPFWIRLMQCLKVYSTTREGKNLWNALKYSTAFPLVYAGYLRRHEPSHFHDQCFVAAAVVQSTYCFIWDVHMDWGLFWLAELRGDSAEGYACCGGKPVVARIREPLLISQSVLAHLALCAFNLALRFIWALSVFGGVPGRGAGMLFFELVEILRRTVWAVFRIEWEVIAKVIYPSGTYKPVNMNTRRGAGEWQSLDRPLQQREAPPPIGRVLE